MNDELLIIVYNKVVLGRCGIDWNRLFLGIL